MSHPKPHDPILSQIDQAARSLPEPESFYAGLRLDDLVLGDNLVVFKRTTGEALKPKGVTHSYHHRFVLLIPLIGHGSVHLDGQSFQLAPGRFQLIFPHQFHRYFDLDPDPINWLFVTFESEHPQRLEPLRNQVHRLPSASAALLESVLQRYLTQRDSEPEMLAVVTDFSRFLHGLLQAPAIDAKLAAKPADDPQGALVHAINDYIRAHLNESPSLADLARHTKYSESHLRAIFRQEFGVSLGKYMRHSRLSVAASLLSQPDRPSIEAIATECGFESIFVFSRAFKKAMGMSPRAYCQFVQAGGVPPAVAAPARKTKTRKSAGG